MSQDATDAVLEKYIAELKGKFGDQVPLSSVGDILRNTASSLQSGIMSHELGLYREIESLADYIHKARADIAALMPEEISAEHIPTATDELDAIVAATEEATGAILDSVEEIEKLAQALPNESGAPIVDVATRIYEACNFQDITGQRIGKIIKALHHIESKVEDLSKAMGRDLKAAAAELKAKREAEKATKKELTEADLLEGPQLAGQGVSQDEVDALLASFD